MYPKEPLDCRIEEQVVVATAESNAAECRQN